MLGLQQSLSSQWPENYSLRWKGWGWSGEQRTLSKSAKLYGLWQAWIVEEGVSYIVWRPLISCFTLVNKDTSLRHLSTSCLLFLFFELWILCGVRPWKTTCWISTTFFRVNNLKSLHCLKCRGKSVRSLCSTCRTNYSSLWKICQPRLWPELSHDTVSMEKKWLVL